MRVEITVALPFRGPDSPTDKRKQCFIFTLPAGVLLLLWGANAINICMQKRSNYMAAADH